MSQQGKIQLTYVIIAPPHLVEEGDRLFRSHAPWMKATHPREGEKALLSYTVSKAPELSNPLDSSSSPTGNVCFVLTEVYETEAGVVNHFQEAQSGWKDFPAVVDWMAKCRVSGAPAAPIINSLW
jgi:hypothetical protein